jgi:hypothetical protein
MSDDMMIDEESSVTITVRPVYADGSPVNLTNASITWVADFNGEEKIRKDTAMMTIMVGPQLATTSAASAAAGQKNITFTKVAAFGADDYSRPITDLVVGDIITIINSSSQEEYLTIAAIDPDTKIVTMTTNLIYTHDNGSVIKRIISEFTFSLLPGDTTLPMTKTYGTPMIWHHMAQAVFPAGLSPGNIYQESNTMVVLRGDLFIDPILDMG